MINMKIKLTYKFVAKQAGSLSSKLTLATCCLNPPLNPMSYRWVLTYQPLTVAYIAPSEETTTGTADAVGQAFNVYPNPYSGAFFVDADGRKSLSRFTPANSPQTYM